MEARMTDVVNNRVEDLKDLIDRVFSTEAGTQLLEFLKEEYSNRTVVRQTTELTYYCLGQKELIDLLESIYKDPDFAQKVDVQSDQTF